MSGDALASLHLCRWTARGDATGRRAFVGVEFGPDGEVIGDFQGLFERQVELLLKVEHAPFTSELGCRGLVNDDVVVLGVLASVCECVAHDRHDAIDTS